MADLIDAAWDIGFQCDGDTAQSDHTTIAYVNGEGTTITPAGGDTAGRLFIPNAGYRDYYNSGSCAEYGVHGTVWSTVPSPVVDPLSTLIYRLRFSISAPSGLIASQPNLLALSLRCVRS